MSKGFVAAIIASVMAASVMAGCGSKTEDADTDKQIQALQKEMESLREENESMKDELEKSGEDKKETDDNKAEDKEEEKADKTETADAEKTDTEDKASDDNDTADIDVDKVYEAYEKWADGNSEIMNGASLFKCILLNDDDIPEVILFSAKGDRFPFLGVLSVNDKYSVNPYFNLETGSRIMEAEYNSETRQYVFPCFSFVGETFEYNPKGSTFSVSHVQPEPPTVESSNWFLELKGSNISLAGDCATQKYEGRKPMFKAGKLPMGQATEDNYNEYIAQFSYSDSFKMKDETKVSIKNALDEYYGK